MQEGAKPSQILVISFTLDPSGALLDFCKRESIKRIQVASMFELRRCLKRVGRHRKVVIETGDLTPSLGSQDPVFELFADYELGTEAILVVPAIYQSEMLSLSIQHIQSLPIIGAIISRTSEAVSLGAILDALILVVPLVRQVDHSESHTANYAHCLLIWPSVWQRKFRAAQILSSIAHSFTECVNFSGLFIKKIGV